MYMCVCVCVCVCISCEATADATACVNDEHLYYQPQQQVMVKKAHLCLRVNLSSLGEPEEMIGLR